MTDICFTQIHFLDTGYCLALEAMMIQGGSWKVRRVHSIAALLQHPRHGWLLWDTGYTTRFYSESLRWPFILYPLITPAVIRSKWAAVNRIKQLGLSPADISSILISHMHSDHTGGLRDFPGSRFIVTQSAWDYASRLTGWSALSRAHIPALIPEDFASRALLLPPFTGPTLGALGPTHDLFEDGSLLLVQLPGHARGQIGALVSGPEGRLFLAADSCYFTASVRDQRRPHPITNRVVDDPAAVGATIDALHEFSLANPDVVFVPTHCPESFRQQLGRMP